MRAINHALTGAIIGLTLAEPAVAIPLAVVSHFVMDAIPHHGEAVKNEAEKAKWLRSDFFRRLLYADAVLCAILVLILAARHPVRWPLAAICAFAAAAPDLLSLNHYQKVRGGRHWKPGLYTAFAGRIQWFERPIGAVVEAAWFVAAVIILVPLLR